MLSALAVADDYAEGKELVDSRLFKEQENFFQTVFEIGRRHKVMNPEKMRGEYGKLVYMLQDSVAPEVSQLMDMSCVCPLKTVHRFLEERGAEAVLTVGPRSSLPSSSSPLRNASPPHRQQPSPPPPPFSLSLTHFVPPPLQDDLITTATREVIADGVKSRIQLNRESKEKHRAIEYLGEKCNPPPPPPRHPRHLQLTACCAGAGTRRGGSPRTR